MAEVSSKKHGRSKNEEPHYELPDAEAFKEAGEVHIFDEGGRQIPFKSLYENKHGTQQLIIFIRHFFCDVSIYQREQSFKCEFNLNRV